MNKSDGPPPFQTPLKDEEERKEVFEWRRLALLGVQKNEGIQESEESYIPTYAPGQGIKDYACNRFFEPRSDDEDEDRSEEKEEEEPLLEAAPLQMQRQVEQVFGWNPNATDRYADQYAVSSSLSTHPEDICAPPYYQPNVDTTGEMPLDQSLMQMNSAFQAFYNLEAMADYHMRLKMKQQQQQRVLEQGLGRLSTLEWSTEENQPLPQYPIPSVSNHVQQQIQLQEAQSRQPPSASASASAASHQQTAFKNQKMKEMRLMTNPQTSAALQSLRAEKGAPLENIWIEMNTSFDVLAMATYPNRVDYNHTKILESLRSGHGDLSKHQRCLTCTVERGIDTPPCPLHPSYIPLMKPITTKIFLPKYKAVTVVCCKNCGGSLMTRGVVSDTFDMIAPLLPEEEKEEKEKKEHKDESMSDERPPSPKPKRYQTSPCHPMLPIPVTEEVRQWFCMIDFELPEDIPKTVEDIMSLKPAMHAAWSMWNSGQVEYLCASQQRSRKTNWPKTDKRFYNRAWFKFRESSYDIFDVKKRLLVLLPCNWISFYNEHKQFGRLLRKTRLRTKKLKSDLFQSAKMGAFKMAQLEESQCELENFIEHLKGLEDAMDQWLQRDVIFKQLMAYFNRYMDAQRALFFDQLKTMFNLDNVGLEEYIKKWKFCKEFKCHTWSLDDAAKWTQETLGKQWERLGRRRQNLALGKKRGGGDVALSEPLPPPKKGSSMSNLDPSNVPYDIPCIGNDPRMGERPMNIDTDWNQSNGERYCSIALGGCGAWDTIWRSRNITFASQYTENCKMWQRPFYPFFRDFSYISSTYVLSLLDCMLTLPYDQKQRMIDLQFLGIKVGGSKPEALLTEHVYVIPYALRMTPAALNQSAKPVKQHATSCYGHIMKHVEDQHKEAKKLIGLFGPFDIGDHDKEDHDMMLEEKDPKKKKSLKDKEKLKQLEEEKEVELEDAIGLTEVERLNQLEEDEIIASTPSPLYWLKHHASTQNTSNDDDLPWASYTSQQLRMVELGLLDPMWVYFCNAKSRVPWHDRDGYCFHPDFMYILVSLVNPLTYRALKTHPATKIISLQAAIQLKNFEIESDVPPADQQPIPLDKEIEDSFMGSMDSKERLTEILTVFAETPHLIGIAPFGDLVYAGDTGSRKTISFYITDDLKKMLRREIALNKAELHKLGRFSQRSAESLYNDYITAFIKNRTRAKNQTARKGGPKTKAQSKNSGTTDAQMSTKKGRLWSDFFIRLIKGSGRLSASINSKLGLNEVELSAEVMMQILSEILVRDDNQPYCQKLIDDSAKERNKLLTILQAIRKQKLQHNECFLQTIFAHVIEGKVGKNFLKSSHMWSWGRPPCDIEPVLLSEREKMAIKKDDVYPGALHIIRLPPSADSLTPEQLRKVVNGDANDIPGVKMDFIDLRRYYSRNQRTPEAGEHGAFKVQKNDFVIVHTVEGDPISSDRPPTLQFIGMYVVIPIESTGYDIGFNPELFTLSNGDFDGDKDKYDQIKNEKGMLEGLKLMNPHLNARDVKTGFSLLGMMQDSIIGMVYMAMRPQEKWHVTRLHHLFYATKTTVALKSRQMDPSMKRPFRTNDFSDAFVARIRQAFLKKVRHELLFRYGASFNNGVSDREIWKSASIDQDTKRARVHVSIYSSYLTNAEMLGNLVPETAHYLRYLDDNPINQDKPPRIEIKDNVFTGIPLKSDLAGSEHSIETYLHTMFPPHVYVQFISDGTKMAIHVNQEVGFTLSQYGSMLTRGTMGHMFRHNRDMRLLEADEYKKTMEQEIEPMRKRIMLMLEADPIEERRRASLTLYELTMMDSYLAKPFQMCMRTRVPAALTLSNHQIQTITNMNVAIKKKLYDLPHKWFDRRSKLTNKIMKDEIEARLHNFRKRCEDLRCAAYECGIEMLLQAYSGAKGNLEKWINLARYPGLQNIDGNLEKRSFGDRINYYFDPGTYTLKSFGFMETPYIRGLPASELWLGKGQSHKMVYDSSGAVNKSGKMEKAGSKLLGDTFVDTNGSVRDHNDAMIQLFYDSTGMNPNRSESVHCWMNIVHDVLSDRLPEIERRAIPSRKEEIEDRHRTWMQEQHPKWAMSEPFWDQHAPRLDTFWPGRAFETVPLERRPVLSQEAQTVETRAHHGGFRLLMHAYKNRCYAEKKCTTRLNLVKDPEKQCVSVDPLIRHILAQGRYLSKRAKEKPASQAERQEEKAEPVVTAFELFEKTTNLRHLLWQLDPTFKMLLKKKDLFTPYHALHHSLDWYLIESLCYAKIVGQYKMTAKEVDYLMGAIFAKWRDSRIPFGEAVGIIAVQSVYVDQTQGMLNKKHMEKTVLNELTKGPDRWNQLLENALKVPKDHLIMVDMAFYSDPEDREWVKEHTGYELWSDPTDFTFFKEATLNALVPSFSYEVWHETPGNDFSYTFERDADDVWTRLKESFNQFPSYPNVIDALNGFQNVDLGSPTNGVDAWNHSEAAVMFPQGFFRMVFDVKECEHYKVNWIKWSRCLRQNLSNSILMYAYFYPANSIAVVHLFKIELKHIPRVETDIESEEEDGRKKTKKRKLEEKKARAYKDKITNLFNRKICKNVIWGAKRLESKMKSNSVTKSKATVHVLEDESICLYHYIRELLQNQFQSTKIKNFDMEEPLASTLDNAAQRSYPPLATRLLEKKYEEEGVGTKMPPVIMKRLIANVQHTEMAEILASIYQFLANPCVDPRSLMLIHPSHIYQLFNSITLAKNSLYTQLRQVLKDMDSKVLGAPVMIIADSVTKGGSFIRFNGTDISELNDDIFTLASHRKTLPNLANAAFRSTRANKHATALRTMLSLPLNKGTNYTVSKRIQMASEPVRKVNFAPLPLSQERADPVLRVQSTMPAQAFDDDDLYNMEDEASSQPQHQSPLHFD